MAKTMGSLGLHYHLMHPGDHAFPADPNGAVYSGGRYHLHYIYKDVSGYETKIAYAHVSSHDMLHWIWHKSSLHPDYTGHGMFSGTGFKTMEGVPAIIYHAQGQWKNHIALAENDQLTQWAESFPINPIVESGLDASKMVEWDPDLFIADSTYYAIFGSRTRKPVGQSTLLKSKDLRHWSYVGEFLKHDMPDVLLNEDISCPNFFKLGDQWVLLCISHTRGARYYVGEWANEQFVPQTHGRLNWRREYFSNPAVDDLYPGIFRTIIPRWWGIFAAETLLTPDGRRIMWAWCPGVGDGQLRLKGIQCLPRELSLGEGNYLRIKPIRELEKQRYDESLIRSLKVKPGISQIAELQGTAVEIRIVLESEEIERLYFGFYLFGDGKGGGLPIFFEPDAGSVRVGAMTAPFDLESLVNGDNEIELRIFVDKYFVEVFFGDRVALIDAYMNYSGRSQVDVVSDGAPVTIKEFTTWRIKPTNKGWLQARSNPALFSGKDGS